MVLDTIDIVYFSERSDGEGCSPDFIRGIGERQYRGFRLRDQRILLLLECL